MFCQAAQLVHILDGHAKELAEEADRERVARETAIKTAKEKIKVADIAEKKAVAAEKNRAMAKKRSAELLAKQNEMDLKLAEAISLNTAQAKELADLRAALEACEEKWYNEGLREFRRASCESSSKVGF